MTLIKTLLAVTALACSPVRAAEKVITFEGNTCGIYKGSFDNDGYVRDSPNTVKVACKIIEKDKVICNAVFLNRVDKPVSFEFIGSVKYVEGVTVVIAYLVDGDKVVADNIMRLVVKPDGVGIFQGFVESLQTGTMCMSDKLAEKKAKKPEPSKEFEAPQTLDI